MYRAVKRVLERALPGRGEADPAHSRVEALRRPRAAGAVLVRGLREARQLMAVGESPKVAISSPAQYCGLRLRRGTRIELPEEHEVLRRWCEALRLAGLAHEIF